MVDTDTITAAAPQPGLLSRIGGIVFSPRDTYAAVAAQPRWFGMLVITVLVGAACQYIVFSSPELQDNIVDARILAMRQAGGGSEQQLTGLETFVEWMPVTYAAATVILGPAIGAAVSGLLLGVFTMLMGGAATFRQVFAVVTHSGVISALSGLFSAALVLAGVSPSGMRPPGATVGVFLPMLEESSFSAVFLDTLNLVLIWWVLSLAIGLGVLYRRRTAPIFASLMTVYVLIALLIAAAGS